MHIQHDLHRAGASFSEQIARGLDVIFDFAVVLAAGLGCWLVFLGDKDPDSFQRYLVASVIAAAAVVAFIGYSRLYDFEAVAEPQSHLRRLVGALGITFLGMLLLAFSLGHADGAFSRLWAYAFFASAALLLIFERFAWARIIHRLAGRGLICRNVAIIGAGEHAVVLLRSLTARRNPWVRIVGVFDDRHRQAAHPIEGHDVAGSLHDLLELAKVERIDDIFVALPWTAEIRLFEIFDSLQAIPANLHLSPEIVSSRMERASFVPYFGITALRVSPKPIEGWNSVLKWTEDKVVALTAILLLLPVMAAVAIAIRLESRGPILFRQSRYGFNNKLIEVYKFRSMYHERRDENAETLAVKGDPRVTRVGRFIRRTSLDELPQLFNVLKGDMSIVGPRPHATRAKAAGRLYEDVVKEYAVRHKIKPGITGWAQVKGWRGETDTEDKIRSRVECDLFYIENWCLQLDVEIMLRTVLAVFSSKGAY